MVAKPKIRPPHREQDQDQATGETEPSRELFGQPTAIQLACASVAGTDLFVTNDNRLSGLVVSGVTFVTGIDRVPY